MAFQNLRNPQYFEIHEIRGFSKSTFFKIIGFSKSDVLPKSANFAIMRFRPFNKLGLSNESQTMPLALNAMHALHCLTSV